MCVYVFVQSVFFFVMEPRKLLSYVTAVLSLASTGDIMAGSYQAQRRSYPENRW